MDARGSTAGWDMGYCTGEEDEEWKEMRGIKAEERKEKGRGLGKAVVGWGEVANMERRTERENERNGKQKGLGEG